jgi:hypothetical protein
VCYAVTADGVELPVVDVTHPSFRFDPDPADLAALAAASIPRIERSARLPRFVVRLAARRSIIAREVIAARGGFVTGLTTYLMKLGPRNLGSGYASGLDRRLAAALSPTCIRVRLRDTARLLAAALAPALAAPGAPLFLLNLGGGTAIDSLNALILLNARDPGLLTRRRILIMVLDVDDQGPRFGAAALAALAAEAGPLRGLDARLEHTVHDWNDAAALRQRLSALDPRGIVAVSSEGGLFEYGSDDAIVGNLAALRDCAPAGCAVVGSIMRDAEAGRAISKTGEVANRLFVVDDFATLARGAGWAVGAVAGGNPLYEVVSLRKSAADLSPAAPSAW